MALLFFNEELMELMRDFYILTRIKIALFDENFTQLISYPSDDKTFCSRMRKNEEFDKKCRESDSISCQKCKETKSFNIYKCHAGLVEATAPIIENGKIIGYMMFGQITDNKNKSELTQQMQEVCRKYNIKEDMTGRIKKIKYRSNSRILAASKIMDACTGYIQLKEMVYPTGKSFFDLIEQFIENHMGEEISVERLCRELGISRTKLYNVMSQYTTGGIASFIRHKRLEKAKHLIKTTKMSVTEISDAVGFSDYNYFLRVFKKKYGVSPKKMMKS